MSYTKRPNTGSKRGRPSRFHSGQSNSRSDSGRFARSSASSSFSSRSSSNSRFGGGERRGGFRRSGGARRRPQQRGMEFHPSQFINKANPNIIEEVFTPKHTFADFAIEEVLAQGIARRGYQEPTPIQDQVIPLILEGKDVVGLANTGTGKTAAFLVPLLNKVLLNRRERVLILAPTRELALQIEQELFQFVRALPERANIFSAICVGGMPIGPQIRTLKKHVHFIIGTPGRVMDLMERKVLNLQDVHSVVLDEADRMLDMGFINDMRFVMERMPKERHTLFFSATMSPVIEKLIHDFLKNPTIVSVKKRDTSKNIDQDIVNVRGMDKVQILHGLVIQPEFEKVIVFGETKFGVERLAKDLARMGVKADSIHGNKSHGQRQRSLKLFKEGKTHVLIATDVAARGLDIDGITHVINFDLPQTYDDYVHRIGRTGRGTKKGKALTFIG